MFRGRSSVNNEDGRLVIRFDDPEDDIDFITLHNLIYYLYTGCVNLRVGTVEYFRKETCHPPGYPEKPDAFDLYKNAKKYLLPKLSDHCFRYLTATLSVSSITERLFRDDDELANHDELKKLYLDFLLNNFTEVKKTEQWRNILNGEEEKDRVVRKFHQSLVVDIFDRLIYVPAKVPDA